MRAGVTKYSIRCPVCRQKFGWDPLQGFPDDCPNPECQSHIGHDRADEDVVVPFIRTDTRTKATDQLYRQMEAGSEFRAQAAAEMLGVPTSEMSGLKITDLRDNQHEGDIAAPPVNNPVSQFMDQNPHMASLATMGPEFARNVGVGFGANAGARTQNFIRQDFSGRGGVTNERLPYEISNNPGYRRRG